MYLYQYYRVYLCVLVLQSTLDLLHDVSINLSIINSCKVFVLYYSSSGCNNV